MARPMLRQQSEGMRLKGGMISRETIVQKLVSSLEPLEYVHALWEGGAIAFGRVDEWSDIDVCLAVDDDKVDRCFSDVERALESLSLIEWKYVPLSTSLNMS